MQKNTINTHKEHLLECRKKWLEENKEHLLQYAKDYRDKHSEQISCECGGHYTRNRRSRHEKSKLHLAFLESIEQNIQHFLYNLISIRII